MRKTAITLADGRELFYFDDSEPYVNGRRTRSLEDSRPLPFRFDPIEGESFPIPVMRQDPLTGDWITIAANRMSRPFLPPVNADPFAPFDPNSEYKDGEIPERDYDVVVFEDRYPSLVETPETKEKVESPHNVDDEPLFWEKPANGRCEIVCFSSDSCQDLASMGPGRMRTVIEAWADRTAALSEMPQIRQIFVFENHGRDVGVTLSHPHGQIYAYPYLTPKTEAMLRQARALVNKTGNPRVNLIQSVREAEINVGTRMVAENEFWAWYVPVAARWPLEFQLVPKSIVPDFSELDEHQRAALADIYLRMLIVFNHFYRDAKGEYIPVSYISAWHQAPVAEEDGRGLLGLHNEFFSFLQAPGKLKYLSGSESGMGAWITDTTPEKITQRAREAARECEELGAFSGLYGPIKWW